MWKYHASEATFPPFQDYPAKEEEKELIHLPISPIVQSFSSCGGNFSELLYCCKCGWVLRFTVVRSAGSVRGMR